MRQEDEMLGLLGYREPRLHNPWACQTHDEVFTGFVTAFLTGPVPP